MTKFCRDCRFFNPPMFADSGDRYRFAKCTALTRPDPVSGREEHRSCDFARLPGAECGSDAKLFVPRKATPHEQVRGMLVASVALEHG